MRTLRTLVDRKWAFRAAMLEIDACVYNIPLDGANCGHNKAVIAKQNNAILNELWRDEIAKSYVSACGHTPENRKHGSLPMV